jgi:hypothetical protein
MSRRKATNYGARRIEGGTETKREDKPGRDTRCKIRGKIDQKRRVEVAKHEAGHALVLELFFPGSVRHAKCYRRAAVYQALLGEGICEGRVALRNSYSSISRKPTLDNLPFVLAVLRASGLFEGNGGIGTDDDDMATWLLEPDPDFQDEEEFKYTLDDYNIASGQADEILNVLVGSVPVQHAVQSIAEAMLESKLVPGRRVRQIIGSYIPDTYAYLESLGLPFPVPLWMYDRRLARELQQAA